MRLPQRLPTIRPLRFRTCVGVALISSMMLMACVQVPHTPNPPPPWTDLEKARLEALMPADVLLLGEQHDAPEHQELERRVIEWMAEQGKLAAVAMEMAPKGRNTRGLPRQASAPEVQAALGWDDAGWPWEAYGPVVMAAVRAGIPVLGANLPRSEQRASMRDTSLDSRLPPAVVETQTQRIRDGHCGLLPESQMQPMTRIQIARDISMAQTIVGALQPGRTVLLVAGNGHVERGLGVPAHLPTPIKAKVISARAGEQAASTPSAVADAIWATPPVTPKDYCAEMKRAAPGKANM